MYHHADKLKDDHCYNPKYFCTTCGRNIREHKEMHNGKRIKVEKITLKQFLPSPTDYTYSKCTHVKPKFEHIHEM